VWCHLYAIIDIYSRYVVGWTVEAAETGERAKEFIAETIGRNGLIPHTVHSDRGTSMTSETVSQMLIDLGVARSHSRPKTSNDNPYSEARFKTIRYSGGYPAHFTGLGGARTWREGFFAYYNHEHRHSGIALHTPASVHSGTADLVREQRAVILADAYARHPERFGRRPRPPVPPETVWINEPRQEIDAPSQSQSHQVGAKRAV
jgi:transposase InsO family protein